MRRPEISKNWIFRKQINGLHFSFMLTLKANPSTGERKPRDVPSSRWRLHSAGTAPFLSPTWTVRHDYTPPRVRFTYQPPVLSLSPESWTAVYIIRSSLFNAHVHKHPSNQGLKHTDFNLRVITSSTGARGFGLPPRNTCLVYILHHTDTAWRPISFLVALESKSFC